MNRLNDEEHVVAHTPQTVWAAKPKRVSTTVVGQQAYRRSDGFGNILSHREGRTWNHDNQKNNGDWIVGGGSWPRLDHV